MGGAPRLRLPQGELVECAERRGIGSPCTARLQHSFIGHSAPVVSCRGRGDVLATSSFDSSIRLWKMEEAPAAGTRRGAAAPEISTCLAVLTDSDEPFLGGPHVRSLRCAEPLSAAPRRSSHFAPTLLTAAASALTTQSGPHPNPPQENSIACVCLPPAQPALLLRGGNDAMVKVWDVNARAVLRSYGGHAGWIWCLEATDESGHVLVSGADNLPADEKSLSCQCRSFLELHDWLLM